MSETLTAPAADRIVTSKDNAPPDPLGSHTAHVADLYTEAGNWLDGAEIENAAQAEAVDRLITDFKDAIEAAKASEVAQTKPLLDEIEAVRASYRPLIGDTKAVTGNAIRAKTMLLGLKSRWARKVEAEAAARAEALRREAAQQAQAAADTARAAQGSGDLQAAEDAEDLIKVAQATLKAATQAEKPAVAGMRNNWVVAGFAPVIQEDGTVIAGERALLLFYLKTNPTALIDACLELARIDVRNGKRTLPGLIIENDRRAV